MIPLLGAPVWLGAQGTRPAGAPEVFTASAEVKNARGAVAATLEVRVNRYSPEFDRTSVEAALKQGGYPKFLTTLRSSPEVGQVMLGGGEPYAIRYARETVTDTGRTVVFVTDKPVFFVGGGRATSKPRAGYEIAILRIDLDGTGKGKGTMAAAARVRPGGDGAVLLDDYAEEPITLTNVTRKPS
jgi:hypothetical protein